MAVRPSEQKQGNCSHPINDLFGCPIDAKIRGYWRSGASLLSVDFEKRQCRIAFSNPGLSQNVSFEDVRRSIRPIADIAEVARGFDKEQFVAYVEFVSCEHCFRLSPDRLEALRSACKLSKHAMVRRDERFSEPVRKFLLSLATNDNWLAVRVKRYWLYLDSKRVEVSARNKVIHVQVDRSGNRKGDQQQIAVPLSVTAVKELTGK